MNRLGRFGILFKAKRFIDNYIIIIRRYGIRLPGILNLAQINNVIIPVDDEVYLGTFTSFFS